MSSGSYLPPPVKAVEIPKPHGGGVRMLGVPEVRWPPRSWLTSPSPRHRFVARTYEASPATLSLPNPPESTVGTGWVCGTYLRS
jgi:hypothetical protein